MVLSGHLIAQIPVDFPATADRVSWIIVNINSLFLSYRISATDIADEVIEVQVLYVPGVLCRELSQAILAIAFAGEIKTVEFALESSSDIFKREIFIYSDESPVRDMHCLD